MEAASRITLLQLLIPKCAVTMYWLVFSHRDTRHIVMCAGKDITLINCCIAQ
jgi:hypothetical protein